MATISGSGLIPKLRGERSMRDAKGRYVRNMEFQVGDLVDCNGSNVSKQKVIGGKVLEVDHFPTSTPYRVSGFTPGEGDPDGNHWCYKNQVTRHVPAPKEGTLEWAIQMARMRDWLDGLDGRFWQYKDGKWVFEDGEELLGDPWSTYGWKLFEDPAKATALPTGTQEHVEAFLQTKVDAIQKQIVALDTKTLGLLKQRKALTEAINILKGAE
jgi:hypothetical protein